MNKQLLIVLFAVCLVSTHAFVKRDVPTGSEMQAQVDAAKKQIEDILSKLSQETTKNLDPDVIKKNFNDLVDAANKAINSFIPTTEATKPAA